MYKRQEYEYLEAVNDGAELAGISQETARRYVAKATSRYGMYRLFARDGHTYIALKDDAK